MIKKQLCFLVLFISLANSYAQNNEKEKTVPLKKLINQLEKEYEVRISFNSKLVASFYCVSFSTEKSLEQKLIHLEKQTNLSFEKISKRYIVVKEKETTKNHTICGYVLNETTKLPVAFASVTINKTSKGIITDATGYFMFNGMFSNQFLKIQFLGYHSKTIPVFTFINQDCQQIYVSENNIELEEVLISDYLTQGISKQNNGGINVAPNKLGILPGLIEPDVLLSLQLLPGIQSPNETASGLHIRGGSPDQNLVLFDGIKMYQSGHFFGLISSFNPYVTKKISLYRGGTRAKYGDRIGGVLDINSGENIPIFKAGFGVNMTHADAYIKTPLFKDKVGIIFSARRSITDLVETITYKNFSESVFQNTRILDGFIENPTRLSNVVNDFYFKDYNLKIIANITDKDKVTVSNLFNKNQLNYAAENERFRESVIDDISIQNKGTRINWQRKESSFWQQSIDFHSSEYQLNYQGSRIRTRNNSNDNETENFLVKNHVNDVGLNYNIGLNLSDKTTVSGGYQYTDNKVLYVFENSFNTPSNNLLSTQNTKNITQAFFGEYTYRKDRRTQVTIGLRVNHFSSAKEWFVEPRFFALRKLSEGFSLKISGEIKNQAVSQIIEFRNNGIGLENDIWAIANNEIPVLQSTQITGGILYQKNGWNLDLDIYHKKIQGLTLMTDDVVTQALLYVNGNSTTIGMDFLLKKRFGNYRSWISYTFSNTAYTYKELNNNIPFSGTYDTPHSVVWSHTYSLNNFSFSLGWKLRSGIPYTNALGIETGNNNRARIVYDKINDQRLPIYQRVDFSSTFKFKFLKTSKTTGKIGFSLMNVFHKKNILDRKYELKVVKTTPGNEELKLVETDKISIGFTPNIVFRVTF